MVIFGETITEGPVTGPMPGEIEKLGKGLPEADQDRVEELPLLMLGGAALKDEIRGIGGAKVVAFAVADCAETLPAPSKAATL